MKRNILWIMADQFNADCLSAAGHPVVRTPNLDQLAATGVRFEQAYVSYPQCIPSRLSYLRGQYCRTHRQYGFRGVIPHDTPTMFSYFKERGWRTGAFGKFHLAPLGYRFKPDVCNPCVYEDFYTANPPGATYEAYLKANGLSFPTHETAGAPGREKPEQPGPMLAPYPEQSVPFLRCFSALANGSPLVFAMLHAPSHLIEDFMGTGFSEAKRRVPYMDGETVKYTALHFSQQARDFWNPPPELCSSREEWEEPIPEYRPAPYLFASGREYQERLDGTYELLDQSHLLSDLVFDDNITAEHLAPYRVLVLSNSACLSDEQREAIRGFVRGGGTLIATHETSLQDELGHKRDDFGLADVFGVSYRGPVAEGEPCGVSICPSGAATRETPQC